MNNLELLERHRKKVAFILAALVLVLLYVSIALFEFYLVHTGKTVFSDTIPLWFVLIIMSPIIYSGLSFAACRIMHKVYRPIRDSIMNLENFTTNVNHEFKTALSEIISSLELWEITQKQSEYTLQALSSAKRLNIILDSLMPLVQYTNSSYRRKNIDIIKAFEWILWEYKEQIQEKQIVLNKNFWSSLYTHVDIGPLSICFQNILGNAIKYNNQAGEISISIWKDFFEIYDTGIGIATENIEKIFERRFQESEWSHGLWVGLSLVKSICDMYHWDIDISSEKNVFTRVKICF